MITIKRPGIKILLSYVFGFIFSLLFIYLAIPFFFDYKKNTGILEKKIFNNFGINLNLTNKPRYNIFPSPRLNLHDVEFLDFSSDPKNFGYITKVVLKVPFKKLVSLEKLDFSHIKLIDANVNVETSEAKNIKRFLNNVRKNKPVEIRTTKINILSKKNLLFSADLKKINIFDTGLFKKINSNGKVFNTDIKLYYEKKYIDTNNPRTNIKITLPEAGLNLKLNINKNKKKNENIYGRANVFFPGNQFYFDYILKNKVVNISSSKLINNYFKGQLFGNLILFPYLNFNLKFDINSLKFKNILNSRLFSNSTLDKLVPIHNKINGDLEINIKDIVSSSNIINSGDIKLEFKNGVLLVKKINLNLEKFGKIQINGKILKKKKKKIFVYNAKIDVDNSKVFYSRFLIPKKNRINIKPITLMGNINLITNEIKIENIFFISEFVKVELGKNEIIMLEEKINEIFSQNSLNNILKYSNLRKIIQSFFVLN